MSGHPTLLKDIENFLYTHAQNMPYKRQLLSIVQTWEEAYQLRIMELERADNAGNRMEDEGAPSQSKRYESDFDPNEHFDDDLRGTRYDDLE